MIIRAEQPGDEAAIGAVTAAAFAPMPYSDQTEPQIIERLRAAGVLALSLVAEDDGVIIGHIAFSPVALEGGEGGWYGLGPVSVLPERQGAGVGGDLVREGLDRLRALGAASCVLLGDPAYYGRFGFRNDHSLVLPDVPREYFQSLVLHGPDAFGIVAFHPGFYGTAQ
ncbi:N-acetyltransferase [Neorhizobium sp. T786]|uniref:GNAT family N-acetyltransferase n=1 Tax=Pseudorhizobium xiangyangii TaxID=2883104 RepID=UPI001D000DB8|nr:N-acetyltransferase [Neorhizobium xiangyangii]MCB5202030.1 N-acetyltransferase [Neorhizobium xiangyangii]